MAGQHSVANFSIVGAVPGSNPPHHSHHFAPNSTEYTYIASAIGLALKMLAHPRAQRVMTALALSYDNIAMRNIMFRGDEAAASRNVTWFLCKLKEAFPRVIIDENLTDLDIMGYHERQYWEGRLSEFNPRQQYIALNARRVRDMFQSAGTGRRFRTFQFMFATTFIHEAAGHLYITFLSNGRIITPREIQVPGYATDEQGGEAGRWLELRLFGGTVEFYRNRNNWQDESQPGMPCMIDANGRGFHVHPSVIDDICQWRVDFPFATTRSPFNPTEQHSMGRLARERAANAAERQARARGVTAFRSMRQHPGFRVRLRDVQEVLQNNSKRLIAVA